MTSYRNSYLAYFLMYLFYYLSWALFSTLISVYLLDLGYQPSQVSLVVSTAFIASMVTQPLIGWLNDQLGIKRVTVLLLVFSLLGGIGMVLTNNLWLILLAYSWTYLLINGSVPVMEKMATASPFAYGKIRIWGTIGYAIGSQVAGIIYDYISPQAIFLGFLGSMLLCLLGLWGTSVGHHGIPQSKMEIQGPKFSLWKQKSYLFYLLIALIFSGITNAGHTYIPAMLEHAGLSVGLATTVVAISVLCESPLTLLSSKFMDQWASKHLMVIMTILVLLQFVIYGLDMGVLSKIVMTLLSKHTAGMLFIMVNLKVVSSLVDEHHLMTALSIVQFVRSLGSIVTQNIVGYILDKSTYTSMSWFLAAMAGIVLILLVFIKLPSGKNQNLFQ